MADYLSILLWVLLALTLVAGFFWAVDIFSWMPRTGPDCECEGRHTKLKVFGCECWCCKEHWSTLKIEGRWFK